MRIATVFCFIFSFIFSTCDETLPPRQEPQNILRAACSFSDGPVIVRDSVVSLASPGTFDVSVTNDYVEGLQDDEYAHVNLEIHVRDHPELYCFATASFGDLMDRSIVAGGLLTLLPRRTATFHKQWSHRNVDGKPFWEFDFVGMTQRFTNGGVPYMETTPIWYTTTGKVWLFKHRQALELPRIEFAVVYYLF